MNLMNKAGDKMTSMLIYVGFILIKWEFFHDDLDLSENEDMFKSLRISWPFHTGLHSTRLQRKNGDQFGLFSSTYNVPNLMKLLNKDIP